MFSLQLIVISSCLMMMVTSQANQFDEVCSLKREYVKCRSFLPNWFFDKGTGSCHAFNPGECASNANNFRTKKICDKRCATPANICTLKKDSGMCRAAMASWYFEPSETSSQKGECKSFVYGGCGGNANHFDSKKKCEDMCAKPAA